MSHPALFTQELADRICEEIAAGSSIAKVCEAEDMVTARTIFKWLRDKEKAEFKVALELAKEERAHLLAEDTLRIADLEVGDVSTEHGSHKDAAEVQDKRLRVETRKWFAAKLLPRVYADKSTTAITGEGGGPVQVVMAVPPDYAAKIAEFDKKFGPNATGSGVSS